MLRAHASAESSGDVRNLIDVSHSLAELYLEGRRLSAAADWLKRLREYLASSQSHSLKDYEHLVAEYRRIAMNLHN